MKQFLDWLFTVAVFLFALWILLVGIRHSFGWPGESEPRCPSTHIFKPAKVLT